MSKIAGDIEIADCIPRLGNGFSRWLGSTLLRVMGWSITGQFPKLPKMVIAVAPHTSNWDFVIGLAVAFRLKLKISYLGKHSIFIPPFDRLLRRWGGIPVERSRSHGVVAQITDAMNDADKMILAVAPEGTRGAIFPWKTGFMQIAKKSQVPVFLIALDYANKQIRLGPVFDVNGTVEQEMEKVYSFFKQVPAKYPEKVQFPN